MPVLLPAIVPPSAQLLELPGAAQLVWQFALAGLAALAELAWQELLF